MNFLAHIYLSGNSENIIVGNFIGDFVKGKQFKKFEGEIKNGILLHREIDRFTDDHPIVLESKKRLWEKYHHYSPVIVDMFYDHFLAKNWPDYHAQPLKQFTSSVYELLYRNLEKLPERVKYMLHYMKEGDWLYHYQHIDGIRQSLTGMSRRTKFKSGLETASNALEANYESFNRDFELFFPELIQHSKHFLSSLTS